MVTDNNQPVLMAARDPYFTVMGGNLYYVKYPLKDSPDSLTVATTRPETILGDTAIAVHPMDARYKDYIGRTAIVPVVNREVPIIADESVQRLDDVRKVQGAFDGVNIKLMKTGGLREARRAIAVARSLDMQIMLGCMIESSAAVPF